VASSSLSELQPHGQLHRGKQKEQTMNPLTHPKKTIPPLLATIVIACFGLSPQLQAVSPAPDGCYPGFTTAEGCNALNFLTTGAGNTGLGWYSLYVNTTGSYSTGVGAGALLLNNADSNTAMGAAAMLLNTTGTENTAIGTDALVYNAGGGFNTAVGAFALFKSTVGLNTAVGDRALFNNMIGDQNTAVGGAGCCGAALFSNVSGRFNTAVGGGALSSNTDGNDNTAVGAGALNSDVHGSENAAVGLNALVNATGSNNVALGSNAGNQAVANDNVYIGYNMQGSPGESNACYIKSIFGQTAAGGSAVFIDANSKLGTVTSSKRYKEAIKPIGTASEALFELNPITFHYKKEIDPAGKSQFGLVAEDVEKVNPDLVVRDKEGKPYSVRYDQVNTLLLNEFLKEHRAFVEEQHKVAQQQKEIDLLKAELRTQRSLIQKVSDRIELKSSTSQVIADDR
jgi:hypothetical protein